MWNVPVRFLVMWSPIVAVSIGGGIYVYECTQTLLSPGTGFTISYPTKGDPLIITCKTYNIDLAQQTIIVDQLVVRKGNGALLARVPHLVATGISAFDGVTPKVQLKDAELWIDRNEKGDLDILDLFEKTASTDSKQPWQVSVRDSVVHLHDRSIPGVAKNEIKISTANFVGLGDHIEGGATLEVEGLAKGQIGIRKDTNGTILTGKNVSGELAPLLARLRAGNEKKLIETIAPLKVDSGTGVGDFTATFTDKSPKFVSNITISTSNFQWEKYHADRLDFTGTISESAVTGIANVSEKKAKADIEGSLTYNKDIVFGGNVNVAGVTPAFLDTFKIKLPKEVTFNESSTKGYLTYLKGQFGWKGRASFTSAALFGLNVPKLDGEVSLQGDQLFATIKPTSIGGTLVDGNFGMNLKTQAILGSFSTPQLNGKDFSRWLPANVLESKARLVGLIDGTLAKPNVFVKGSIDPRIKLSDRTLTYNSADVVLRYDGTTFNLERLSLTDDDGSLFASGTLDLKKGINVRVVGNNVDLTKLTSTASGKLDVQGLVTGQLKDPRYVGKVQGYQIAYAGIAGKVVAVAADFKGDQKGIQFTEMDAMKGASQITGSLGIGFADQKLAGMFAVDGVEVSDLYEGEVGGILDLKNITVSGTISKPYVTGDFDATKILAYDFAANSAHGKVSFDGDRFRIFDTNAVFANGAITDISGELDAKTRTGKVVGKFAKLDLADIQQSGRQKAKITKNDDLYQALSQLAVKGTSSGSFEFGISDGKFGTMLGNGRVDDVFVNKALIGSGDWDVAYDGNKWEGNALIGSLAEYFRLDGLSYVPSTQEIGGEFLSYQIPLRELIQAAEPSLNWSPDMVEKLDLVSGRLNAFAKFSGTMKTPTVEIPDFEISSIKLGKEGQGTTEDIGTFSMKALLNNEAFTITDGLLVGPKVTKIALPFVGAVNLPANMILPDGTAKLSGTVKDRNKLTYDLTGSIFGFPVSKFAPIVPALSDVDVFVNQASFRLGGDIMAPILTSNFQMSAGLTPEGNRPSSGILATRLKVEGDLTAKPGKKGIGEEGASQVEGKGTFKFDSIQGAVDFGFLTTSSITDIDRNAPFTLSAKLDGERDVTDFLKNTGGFVLGEKGARLSGGIEVGNTLANKTFKGGFDLKADSVKSVSVQPMIGKPLDTILRDLTLSATFENDATVGDVLRTKISSATNYSAQDPKDPDFGYVRFDAKIPVKEITNLNSQDAGWRNTSIRDGSLAFSNLGLYQSFAQGTYAQGSLFTEPGKPLTIAGTLSKPKLGGSIFFEDVRTIIPTLLPTAGIASSPIIEPEFDIKFFAKNPMSIKSSLTSVNAKGTGSIRGTLSDLQADGVLTVESGDLLLPGGKVKLTPDGTLTLKYDSSAFNNQAQLIADLRGEASSTSLRNGTTPERYEISLIIKGDLLATEANALDNPNDQSATKGLSITATSQFGPLNQQEIAQLLGRTDILQSLLQSGVNSDFRNELENTLTGIFLPSALSGITNEIARNFKLDYVGVDYNAFEQASISIVKNLGNGFFLQGRQQLMQPLPGKPVAYDFRLVYRPRRGPNAIRALSFSLGTDQLRPYKFSIDYTTQIRTRKGPYRTIKLDVPNK